MKKIIVIFSFLLLLSVSAFAQTITWTSSHPRALTQGTNTFSGGSNSGSISVAQWAQSCTFLGDVCLGGDNSYSDAEWHEDYTYSLNFYDSNGNLIGVGLTITNTSHVNCGSNPNNPEIEYQTFTWSGGSVPIVYIEEIVTVNHFQIYGAGNTECYYNLDTDNGTPQYPLGSPFSGVLLGPLNNPLAIGTTDNDDYTNKSLLGNIVGTTTTTSQIISFQNTVRNKDTISDSAVITAPSVPSGFTVEASPDCSSYSTISSGGNITISGIPASSNATFCVRITAPSGINTFTPFSTLLRATSVNDPIKINDTIDRIYSGYITSAKSATVTNGTGVGGATDPVPGAVIQYFINYQNIANTPYGTGNYDLVGSNLTITEDGNLAPNNWATYTNHVPGSASDSNGGSISGDTAGSNLLTDIIPSLNPGSSGVFSFSRRIK